MNALRNACRTAATEGFISYKLAAGADPMTLSPTSGGWNDRLLAEHNERIVTLLYERGFDIYALRRLARADEVDPLYTLLFASVYTEA